MVGVSGVVPAAWVEEVEGSGGGGAIATLESWMADGYGVDGGPELRCLTTAEEVGPPAAAAGLLRCRRGSLWARVACFFFRRGIERLRLWSCVAMIRVC
jgi:hypothetical protein